MYPLVLAVHSLLRWAVLSAGLYACGRALAGARGGRGWTPADARAGLWFMVAADLQFVLGLALYAGLSPIPRIAFQDFGAAMGNAVLRFWAVEHIFGMTVALALVHIGRVRVRKTEDVRRRHILAAILFGLALVTMAATIPWPGLPAGRPLLRGF
ncbi:MAG: hypothetical protein HY824_09220 [Acidobacteria bacterium]|nr:hypothetical protein [Acidobacteriota bacterium]